jgi:DNA-binding CsgD family transcriptional regulator
MSGSWQNVTTARCKNRIKRINAMTLNGSRLNILPSMPPFNYAAQRLNQLQADLVSTARTWAVDEVSAAIAHQLNEPLTALLLYLNGIREQCERSTATGSGPDSLIEMVEKALHETERVCSITERMGHTVVTPVDAETAFSRGREAIEWWTRSGGLKADGHALPDPLQPGQRSLTPREREVLTLITGGASNKEGGHELGISTRTFEVHRARIMGKLGAKNAADLVRMALSEPK